MSALPRLLCMKEVCSVYGVTRYAIYDWVRAGKFPKPVMLGRSPRWPEEEIAEHRAKLLERRG